MAKNLPEGFELVDDALPEGFELVPDGYELVPEEKGFWSTVGDYGAQLGKNIGGGLVGLADLATGAISAPVGYLKAGAAVAGGADPQKELEEARRVSTDNVGAAIARMGLGDPRENPTYKYMMKPFELIGEGAQKVAEKTGMGPTGQLAMEGVLSLAPLPGAKALGKGLGHVAERVDPALRALDRETVSGTRERLQIPEGFEEVAPSTRETSTDGNVTVSWDHPDAQAELMQPINPYDVGGHVTEFKEGRTTQIDPLERELMGRVENIEAVPDVLRDVVDAYKTREFTERATQGELFDPYTNMHREFDQYGNERLPREMTRKEFEETVRNLVSEEGTRFRMPENMDEAYQAYKDTISSEQGGLFDRESQRAAFAEVARQEGIDRLSEYTTPDLSVYGERVRGEPQGSLDLGPGGREIAAQGTTRAPDVAPVEGQYVPPQVPQQFADVAAKVPGLDRVLKEAPVETPRTPERSAGITPSETVVKNVPGLGEKAQRFIHENLTPEQVVKAAIGEKDGSAAWITRLAGSGANLTALTRAGGRGSSLIKGAYGLWNAAENTTRRLISERVLPIERSLHALNRADRELLASVLKNEMMNQARTENIPPRLQNAYNRLRKGLEDAGNAVNEARVAQGLEPMTMTDYYLSSRWRGNYKMEVRDANGNLLYFLREPSKRQLNAAKAALEKKVPGLKYTEVEPSYKGVQKTDQLEAGYNEMLKLLDPNDPRVDALVSAYEEHVAGRSVPSMGMPFHAEAKGNVRGFIGDKPNRTEKQNAIELLNSQIQYMKNSYKWAEQQKANQKVSEIISDPTLRETQPNNIKYVQEYSKNAMGFGTAKSIRDLEVDLSRGLGFDREQSLAALNMVRSWFYTKNLGLLNPKAMFVQMVQPLFMAPAHLNLMENGFKANPVTVYANTIKDTSALWSNRELRPEMKNALDYAQQNGILSINVLDDIRNIGQSELSRKAQNLANINQIKAEEFGRTVSYISAVNHLYESGLRGETLYRSAEAVTNRVMVDYRKFEQPMWMEKMGATGRAVGTLKTFMNNQYHQLLYYAQEAGKGRVTGLAGMLGLQYALAGAMGMYGVQTVSDVYDNYIRKAMGPSKADKSMKGWLLSNLSDLEAYGGFSKITGINMYGSMSQGNLGGDSLGAIAAPFASDLYKSVGAIGSAVMDPTNPEKWSQALYENLPPHGKGMMETFMPQYTSPSGMSLNPRDLSKGMYKRDTFEKALRVLGATSIKESATKERAFETARQEMDINKAKQELIKGYVQARRIGDKESQQKAIDVLKRWMAPDELAQSLTNAVLEAAKATNQDVVRRNMPDNLDTVNNIRKYQRQGEMRGPQ